MTTPEISPVALALAYTGLFGVAVVLTAVDAREHRLPNRIVFPATFVVVALCLLDAAWRGGTSTLMRALLGGVVLMGGYFLLYRNPAAVRDAGRAGASGMGAGDVKLAFPLGIVLAWHGWIPLLIATISAFVIAGVAVMFAIACGRAHRGSLIAFGPFMLMGAVLGVASAHETLVATIVGV